MLPNFAPQLVQAQQQANGRQQNPEHGMVRMHPSSTLPMLGAAHRVFGAVPQQQLALSPCRIFKTDCPNPPPLGPNQMRVFLDQGEVVDVGYNVFLFQLMLVMHKHRMGQQEGLKRRGPPAVNPTSDRPSPMSTRRSSAKTCVNQDGYRWLKYGQKFLTNSQLYREYFKCAEASCTAKKHVEVEPVTGKVVSSTTTDHNHGDGPRLIPVEPRRKKQRGGADDATKDPSTKDDVPLDSDEPKAGEPEAAQPTCTPSNGSSQREPATVCKVD
eukprot:TRINITY_DN23881_c0_g1_i1.p1 TRINITY_DN23881_c0_g1~~TRINITY_DN23881_c0_g1_i1.p1  ORF type:complete len:270 (-),score=38.28 TRINITY_DN23881_c0_g1_i1:292-1101(-)